MPQTKNAKEINDPVLEAAMLASEDDDEETKEIREKHFGKPEEDPKDSKDEEDEDDSEDAPEDSDDSDDDEDEDEDEDSDEDDSKDDPVKPDPKKPVEADDDPESDEDRKTRKEKRQERNESYLQSIRKDNARNLADPEIPDYQPLQYDGLDAEGNPIEFKPEDLSRDREMVGAVGFAKGAVEARKAVEQDNFWRELGHESKLVAYDPALQTLSEQKPDGTPNPSFDPDQAEYVNERYLQTIGYKEHYRTDAQGRYIYDNAGNPIVASRTVDRTDISYEKFARRELQQIEKLAKKYIDEQEDDTRKNIITQRKNQGVRPGSGRRKSLGTLQHGDIANMSDDDFEKHEDAINAKILRELGQ